MSSRQLSRINEMFEELDQLQIIPSSYHSILQERLTITCATSSSHNRQATAQSSKDIRSRHKQKKANRVYLAILDNDPNLLVPFILAISPRACETFNILEFYHHHSKAKKLHLDNDTNLLLEKISRESRIDQSPYYKRLTEALFPKALFQVPRPVSTAESNDCWTYDAADLNSIRIIFGEHISEAVENSPLRLEEKMNSSKLRTTEGVKTKFPRKDFQDGIIWLDIGYANNLAMILFPQSRYLESFGSETEGQQYVTFKAASVSAVTPIFSPSMCNAIDASQLRMWEKEHGLSDTTDCVTLQVYCKEPHHGVLRLRIGFIIGMQIANSLYAETYII